MSESKVRALREWPIPQKLRDVRAFLGFANFYRRFIKGYSEIVRPLTALTRKEVPWVWGEEQNMAFEELKAPFTVSRSWPGSTRIEKPW